MIRIFLLLWFANTTLLFAQSVEVQSPDATLVATLTATDSLRLSISTRGTQVLAPSTIGLLTNQFSVATGTSIRFRKPVITKVNATITNPVPYKRKHIPDHYSEAVFSGMGPWALILRVYNDGVAYRFKLKTSDSVNIISEVADFKFPVIDRAWYANIAKRPDQDIYHTSFEEPYLNSPGDSIQSGLAYTPVLVKAKNINVFITDADVDNYPGMFLRTGKSFKGTFAPYPLQEEVMGGEFKQKIVTKRQPFIAKAAPNQLLPWRVIGVSATDGGLLMNDLVYRLGKPADNRDWSWIKPGISTEEWICATNLKGVPFKAGVNTATYKHYIDFASRFGLSFVMLDAGWSDYNNLLKTTPDIDLEAIAAYAKSKNISLILWTLAMTLDQQLEPALTYFEKLGVKAIMTDFMDRDDQKMMDFYSRIAAATANHKIMVMFHGAFKNTGLERTWPHLITREGVIGSEYNIWSDKASPDHDVTIPFTRMITGPMDYEPGFMTNANKATFRPLPLKVMSQGTRTHQLAMFIVYESPMQMFSGNPSDSWPEIDYMGFIANLPTTWHDLKVVDAKIGDYVIVARRNDNDWYLGGMTDWNEREFVVKLDFLGPGSYRFFSCADGPNAAKNAEDYQFGYQLVNSTSEVRIKMAPGGGFAARIIKLDDARP